MIYDPLKEWDAIKTLLRYIVGSLLALTPLALAAEDIEAGTIELEAFVVYSGLIDVVDGFTGEPYHENSRVVDGFREEFNNILLAYHRKLVNDEFKALKAHVARDEAFIDDLSALAGSFGAEGFSIDKKFILSRDKSMLARLVKDPFFKIENLIVWDLDKLARYKEGKPRSEYGEDLQYNATLERWERRITTHWEVSYDAGGGGQQSRYVNVYKEQGLNLETNRGYHFCPPGVPAFVPPYAFKDVILNYPIFINAEDPAPQQIERLKNEFVINLSHIYDPFSWAFRSNIRYRGTFYRQLLEHIQSENFPVKDRDWFDQVFTRLLCDVTTIKRHGAGEVYDFAMLLKVPVNKNRLGEGLDLLNWNEGEDRKVNYDPTRQYPVQINFESARDARFILVDAYRRYEERFIETLRERLANTEDKISGKALIEEVLTEVSGVPAEIYIREATKAQMAELEKYRHKL